jgi:hypothetical protein
MDLVFNIITLYCNSKHCAMMSHLCNRCVREFLILARIWFAFGLPSKIGCDISDIEVWWPMGIHPSSLKGVDSFSGEAKVFQMSQNRL